MKQTTKYVTYLLAAILFINISCESNTTGSDENLPESLEPVEEVSKIPGAESTTMTVNTNIPESYFTLEFSEIESNDIIDNGSRNGWCIDVYKPIGHDDEVYKNIQLYSTYRVESWKPINYLFNIKEELQKEDTDLTWKEFQVAIWSLRSNPDFDLDEVDIEDLPSQFHRDGELNFSPEKVDKLVNRAEDYEDFEFTSGTKFAVIAETPSDTQTVITFVE